MHTHTLYLTLLAAATMTTLPAAAQQKMAHMKCCKSDSTAVEHETEHKAEHTGRMACCDRKRDTLNMSSTELNKNDSPVAAPSLYRSIEIQRARPLDQRGLLMFEFPKETTVPFRGFTISWGAAFTQQFQGLTHRNAAAERMVSGTDANKLMGIGNGFNNAAANLYLNAQLAPGIRVALESYLSSKHHNETWVKDGYLLIDESPIRVAPLEKIMEYVTIKTGHFEINYGDAHFRRSDNGNALYNPFVGNHILDAFTTEIGGEVYARVGPAMAMAAVTGGEVKGTVQANSTRSPSYIGKLGYDKQLNGDLRFRLTGSAYRNYKSGSNTLFSGDRAGSRYNLVMENTTATPAAAAWSGNINPGFRNTVTAFQVNPFVKYRNIEFFGVDEMAKGKAKNEQGERTVHQYAGDLVYRFLEGEKVYVGLRYNRVNGALPGIANKIRVNRQAFAAGWFMTPGLLLKGELVTQQYNDFPVSDIRHDGRFRGFVVEGVVAF